MGDRRILTAAARAGILLELVPYLINRGEVALDDAADEFGVTSAQMRELVMRIPFVGTPSGGGYASLHNDLFDIDWDALDDDDTIRITQIVGLDRTPRLTAREAAALVAGLQIAGAFPGVGDSGVYSGLVRKLSRGAASAPPEVVVAPRPVDEVRLAVAEALRTGVAVTFRYRAPDAEETLRTVDPSGVIIANDQWYLQGWCHLRRARRTFHLDRVSDITVTDVPLSHPAEVPGELFTTGTDQATVTLRFPEGIAPVIGDWIDRAVLSTSEAVTTARLPVADPRALKRLAARTGGAVEVVAPADARESALAWARAALDQYGDDADSARR